MQKYTFAFGDTEYFIKTPRSFTDAEMAFNFMAYGTPVNIILYIFANAIHSHTLDCFVGGELILTIDLRKVSSRLFNKHDRTKRYKPTFHFWKFFNRYLRFCLRAYEKSEATRSTSF